MTWRRIGMLATLTLAVALFVSPLVAALLALTLWHERRSL